jgi:hypothetical protein
LGACGDNPPLICMPKFSELQIQKGLDVPLNFDIVKQVASQMFKTADTPFSLALDVLLSNGDYPELTSARTHLEGDIDTVSLNVACESLVRKYKGFEHPDLDPQRSARVSFYGAEAQCRQTNRRLAELCRGGWNEDLEFLYQVAGEIASILGAFDPEEWLASMSFGPGKGLGTDALHVAPYYKMSVRPSYCGQDLALAEAVFKHCPGWLDVGKTIEERAASELIFVPKDAGTFRAICIEPIINLFAQKGIGKMIRRRLKAFGCDLDFGQSRQQLFARLASISGTLCTLDLRAASDTIAFFLVEFLLPREWFHAMAAFRCGSTDDCGYTHRLSKFSSMGNGYTFELESLIFFAATRVVCGTRNSRNIGVYGDDIIVPTECVTQVVERLGFMGFTINDSKSHTRGGFRESCGGNYYYGHETSTIYITEPVNTVKDAFLLANRLLARANSCTNPAVRRCFERCHAVVVNAIPKPARLCRYPISLGESDVGLAVNPGDFDFPEYDKDLQCWYATSWAYISRPLEVRSDSVWSAKAHMLYEVERSQNRGPARVKPGVPQRARLD